MKPMPILETPRLQIRPFVPTDADAVYQVMASINPLEHGQSEAEARAANQSMIEWLSLNHTQLAALHQPPYGDRAVVLRETGQLIGLCGLVPYLADLGVFPYFGGQEKPKFITDVGLFWTIGATAQKRGYATEAANALIDYAFTELNLHHIIATTGYDNAASQRVMEKVGMRLERNPFDEPPYLQVLGVVES